MTGVLCTVYGAQVYFQHVTVNTHIFFCLIILTHNLSTLNASNNVDICLIPSRFHMWVYKELRIYIPVHKINETYLLRRTFVYNIFISFQITYRLCQEILPLLETSVVMSIATSIQVRNLEYTIRIL